MTPRDRTPEEERLVLRISRHGVGLGLYSPTAEAILDEIRRAVADEREACARLVEEWVKIEIPAAVARRIRARGTL